MTVLVERTVTMMGPPASPEIGNQIPLGIGVSMAQLYGPATTAELVPRAPYLPRSLTTVAPLAATLAPTASAVLNSTIPLGLGVALTTFTGPITETPADAAFIPIVEILMPTVSDFVVKQGTTFPPLVALLQDVNGPYDLTGCAVLFVMAARSGGAVVVSAAATVNPDQVAYKGQVTYAWAPANTVAAGRFIAEFVVTSPSGMPLRFPSGGSFTVSVTPKVGI